jgi:phosphoserine phosphatase
LLPRGVRAVQQENKRYLTGIPCDLVLRYMGSIVFFEEAIARVLWHAQQGHRMFVVSGTLEPLAQLAATALECEVEARGVTLRSRVSATQLTEVRGRWTGEIRGEALYGRAKARRVKAIAAAEKIDLCECYAYGNSLLDRHFLCAVGHGHAVNPGKDLASLANQKNWPIWRWSVGKHVTPTRGPCVSQKIHQNEGAA